MFLLFCTFVILCNHSTHFIACQAINDIKISCNAKYCSVVNKNAMVTTLKRRLEGDKMIRFKLREMLSDKAFREGKRINLDELSGLTGVNKSTLSRISSVRGYNTTTDNIDKLCRYFGCSVDKLLEYVPDEEITGT